jgi:hypothetical protein
MKGLVAPQTRQRTYSTNRPTQACARRRAALTLDVVLLFEPEDALQRRDSDGIVVARYFKDNEDDRGTLVLSCRHRQGYTLQLDNTDGRCSENAKGGAGVGFVSKYSDGDGRTCRCRRARHATSVRIYFGECLSPSPRPPARGCC